jgi:toxin ParE1/3/4
MAYLVSITSRGERDLADLYGEIKADQSDAALEWYRALKDSILSLEEQPNRCPLIRKRNKLRHLFYGHKPHVYRVIYRVLEKRKLKCSTSGMAHGGSPKRQIWPKWTLARFDFETNLAPFSSNSFLGGGVAL